MTFFGRDAETNAASMGDISYLHVKIIAFSWYNSVTGGDKRSCVI